MEKATLILRSGDGLDYARAVTVEYADCDDLDLKADLVHETIEAVKDADPEEFTWDDIVKALEDLDGVEINPVQTVTDTYWDSFN